MSGRGKDDIALFARISRFKCVGLVLDMQVPDIAASVEHYVLSLDARRALTLARGLKARYLVLAGQLHRKKAGAFSMLIFRDDIDALCAAAVAAHDRLSELGETDSLWLVFGDEAKAPVTAALAQVSAVRGSA